MKPASKSPVACLSQRRGVPTHTPSRSAITLVETLVVIAVLATLIVLLFPAVQRAREAAHRAQCSTNLKQLGVALHNYHSLYGRFPASITFDLGQDDYPDGPNKYRKNWVIAVLPFMDQQTLYDQFNFDEPINAPANAAARGTDLSVMLCPSDGSGTRFGKRPLHFQGTDWARGNYGANACLGHCYWFPEAEAKGTWAHNTLACGGPEQPYWRGSSQWDAGYSRGIMGANTSIGLDKVRDGASKTILLCELRQGLSNFDRRGTWAMGGPGASSLWGHASALGTFPNAPGGDNIGSCEEITASVGPEHVAAEGMTCGPLGDPSTNQAVPRSKHVGGVFVCMVDGSVHFINDAIENGSLDRSNFLTWQRLNASADGQFVDNRKFADASAAH